MDFSIELKKWSIILDEGQRKIAGEFVVMAGATEVAQKNFNEGWNCAKVVFPTELMVKAEALTAEIKAHITKTFTGKEG